MRSSPRSKAHSEPEGGEDCFEQEFDRAAGTCQSRQGRRQRAASKARLAAAGASFASHCILFIAIRIGKLGSMPLSLAFTPTYTFLLELKRKTHRSCRAGSFPVF